eukprot:TRINITY_DN931_c0_g2_i1.p1 TRINITY_DN931_c0_g2~~TRINITY_DN931_c0_g2_i1.p1  ORF type:complete len:1019 (+),score=193.25 TRINITY_DN931_c0_g2_i1:26-3058(+)
MASEGEDSGGTFWSTFAGPGSGGTELSPLEQLLEFPDCSVDELLDQEDVIQEFKSENKALVARLCKPDAIRTLIGFITTEPPSDARKSRCFRYPFVAVELMTCGAGQFLKALSSPENRELSDVFWSFLEATPADELNPVLAGYFARAAGALLANWRSASASEAGNQTEDFVERLRLRSADMLDRFLERLHLRSLADLFAGLMCAEQQEHMVFSVDDLATKLITRLADEHSQAEAQENVAVITIGMLAQMDKIFCSEELLRQLTSSQIINVLVDQIFSDKATAVAAASSILANVVFHAYVAPKGVRVACTSPTLSPASRPITPLHIDDDLVNVGADEIFMKLGADDAAMELGNVEADDSVEAMRPLARQSSPSSPRSLGSPLRTETAASWLHGRGATLIKEVTSHLPRLRSFLDKTLSECPQTPLSPATSSTNLVGSTTLEMVNLFTMLVRTGSSLVLESVLREQLLGRCVELFFRHPWSTLLHNAVKELIGEVMSDIDGIRPKLLLDLLCDGGLLERIVGEYAAEWEVRASSTKPRGPRVGYMGHLHNLCCDLREYGCRVPEIGSALQAQVGWTDNVVVALEATLKVQSEQLGGGVPSEDRGLASTGGTISDRGSSDQGLDLGSITRSDLDSDFQLMSLKEWDEDDIGWQHDGSSGQSDSPERGDRNEGRDMSDDSESPPIIPVLEDTTNHGFYAHGSFERPSAPSPGSDRYSGVEPPAPTDPLMSPSPPPAPPEPLPVVEATSEHDLNVHAFAAFDAGSKPPYQPPSPPSPPAIAGEQARDMWRADFDSWAAPPLDVGTSMPVSSSLDADSGASPEDSLAPAAGAWVATFDTISNPEASASPSSAVSPWDVQPSAPLVSRVSPAAPTPPATAAEHTWTQADVPLTSTPTATLVPSGSKLVVAEEAPVRSATMSATFADPVAVEPEVSAANASLFALLGQDLGPAPAPAAPASQVSGESNARTNTNTCTNTASPSTPPSLPWTANFDGDSLETAPTAKQSDAGIGSQRYR